MLEKTVFRKRRGNVLLYIAQQLIDESEIMNLIRQHSFCNSTGESRASNSGPNNLAIVVIQYTAGWETADGNRGGNRTF